MSSSYISGLPDEVLEVILGHLATGLDLTCLLMAVPQLRRRKGLERAAASMGLRALVNSPEEEASR